MRRAVVFPQDPTWERARFEYDRESEKMLDSMDEAGVYQAIVERAQGRRALDRDKIFHAARW